MQYANLMFFQILKLYSQVYKSQGRSHRIHLQIWDTAGQER